MKATFQNFSSKSGDWFYSAKQFEGKHVLDSITLNERFAYFNKELFNEILKSNKTSAPKIFNEMGIIEYKRKVTEFWKAN